MPKLGDIVHDSSDQEQKPKPKTSDKLEVPPELIGEMIATTRNHIRMSIVDAGMQELPDQLQQFTELLNAASSLANMSPNKNSDDNTKLILQTLGYLLKTPELRDKILSIIKGVPKNPPPKS